MVDILPPGQLMSSSLCKWDIEVKSRCDRGVVYSGPLLSTWAPSTFADSGRYETEMITVPSATDREKSCRLNGVVQEFGNQSFTAGRKTLR